MEGHRRSFSIIRFKWGNYWWGCGWWHSQILTGLDLGLRLKTAGKCCVVYGNKIKSHKHGIKWYVQWTINIMYFSTKFQIHSLKEEFISSYNSFGQVGDPILCFSLSSSNSFKPWLTRLNMTTSLLSIIARLSSESGMKLSSHTVSSLITMVAVSS